MSQPARMKRKRARVPSSTGKQNSIVHLALIDLIIFKSALFSERAMSCVLSGNSFSFEWMNMMALVVSAYSDRRTLGQEVQLDVFRAHGSHIELC